MKHLYFIFQAVYYRLTATFKTALGLHCLLILLFAGNGLMAQTIDWEQTYGGSSSEYAHSISPTGDGGYILAGHTFSNNGDITSGNQGDRDVWVIKLDSDGSLDWEQTYGGSADDEAHSISPTDDGGYILVGYTLSDDGDITTGNQGDRDVWVVKLDSDGSLAWEQTFGGSGSDEAQSISPTDDGGYILAGYNTFTFPSGNLGSFDVWAVKLDSDGNLVWEQTYGGSGNDVALSISPTDDGGYILAGHTDSNNGDITSGNQGYQDVWAVKLNSDGSIAWERTYGGSGYDYARSIFPTADGGYILAGSTYSNNGDITSGNQGGTDIWAVKLDSDGSLDWEQTYGGSGFDEAYSISPTGDGGYILAGSTYSNNGDITSGNQGVTDIWAVKLDSDGSLGWEQTYGGSSSDEAYSISPTDDGGYILAGSTYSNNGDITSGNQGGTDVWVVKLQSSDITPTNNILYVDKNASGGNQNGNSWANAIPELRDALSWAATGWDATTDGTLQIWVAQGIYTPTADATDRDATFQLVNGVELYGGFDPANGIIDLTHDRILPSFGGAGGGQGSILSGDIDNNDTAEVVTDPDTQIVGDNSYTVVTGSSTDNTAKLDGFTVTAGYAQTCNTTSNTPGCSGAGIYNNGGSPTLLNMFISGNRAANHGGGMFNNNSSPSIANSNFSNNTANSGGGGMYNIDSSSPNLTNVSITGNTAGYGGGMRNYLTSSPNLTNVTISGNTATNGSEWHNNSGTPVIRNSIIFGNGVDGQLSDTEYSLVQDQNDYSGTGNIDPSGLTADDIFTDPANGDFSLQNTSPAINAGSNQLWIDAMGPLSGAEVDLAGNVRIYDYANSGIIDIGAYEYQGDPAEQISPTNGVLYVDKNVSGGNQSGDSWTNALPELADALSWAATGWDATTDGTLQIWVAQGIYTPTADATDRDATFQLVNGVELYGGFDPANGIIDLTHDRILPSFGGAGGGQGSILSGDIDTNDTANVITDPDNEIQGNNSYTVVNGYNTDTTAVLNGFTLTAGNADATTGILPARYGGGIYNNGGSPTLSNTLISGNRAAIGGGGMYNSDSSPSLTNVTISGNTAGSYGGGMYNSDSSPSLTNVTLSDNTANINGGGMYNQLNSFPSLINSIVWGDIYNSISSVSLSYSLIEGNTTTTDGNIDATGITDTDIFTDPANGDFSLQNTSPAINAGDNTLYTTAGGDLQNDMDLAGNVRVYDYANSGIIDIGAYEYQGDPAEQISPTNGVLYVDKNVSGGNQSGDSWANALPELRDALSWAATDWDATTNGTLQIWVADGLYYPTDDATDRNATFQMLNNVEVYGGFAGTEPDTYDLSLRDFATNTSILSGDIDADDTANVITDPDTQIQGNNSYTVVNGSGTDNSVLLNGFTITAGNADGATAGASPAGSGGGIYILNGSPVIAHTSVTGNKATVYGGGMFINVSGSPVLTHLTIRHNKAGASGGGVNNLSSNINLTISHSSIAENTTDAHGGGMNNWGTLNLTNTTISGNIANSFGGGMNNWGTLNLTNTTLSGNNASNYGGGISNYPGSTATLSNTILWGNTAGIEGDEIYNWSDSSAGDVTLTLTNCLYPDGNSGIYNDSLVGGTITVNETNSLHNDPQFMDATNSDFSLQNTSPAINAGDNTLYTTAGGDLQNDMDLAGNARLIGTTIDMGAYEVQNTPPTASCQDITVSLDANGEVSITAEDIDNGSMDNEGEVTLSVDMTDFDCSNIGENTVTLTVEDEDGATTTCEATVTVEDNLPPVPDVANLPDIEMECEVLESDITPPIATDNCGGTVTVTHDTTFPISTQGATVITWTYEDEHNNTDTQTQNIIIEDVTAPVPDMANLPDIEMECEVTATDIPILTATDNCEGIINATTTDPLSYTDQGTYTITWEYDDGNGNMGSQTQTIIVNDVTAPVPDVANLPDIEMECEVTATDIPIPTATDNCEGTINATTTDPLSYTDQGAYTITWEYDDGNGNMGSQTQTIIVNDVTAPVPDMANLPDIEMECEVLAADIPIPTATDNCVGSINATTTDPLSYTDQGTYTITWEYDDGNGNTSSQTQTIIVNDVTAPVPDMTNLPDIEMECEVTATDIPIPTATDNCEGIINATTTDPLSYTEQGTYTITWEYDDGNGNTSSQTQTIIVNDVTAPVPDVANLLDIEMECEVLASDIPIPTATDNCTGSINATTTDPLSYTAQGTYMITWEYDDGNGNTSSQTQNIIVNDITAPVPDVANLPDIEMECEVTAADIPIPTATDNCTGSIMATTTDPLDYSTQGNYTITWEYDDGNGNIGSQTQHVVVLPSPLNQVTFDDATVTYDGNVHILSVQNLPSGVSVSYTTAPNTGTPNGAINAGTYTITAEIAPPATAVNCEGITLTAVLTINKAPQEIVFDSLPIKYLEDDADFQLEAAATSGLPVSYTFDYNADTPPADVSPSGWVMLLTSGLVEITAQQEGNDNYLPASEVMQPLQINSRDASIHHIQVEDQGYENPGSEIYYTTDCGFTGNVVTVHIETEVNAQVIPGHTFEIAIPKPGIYTQEVQVTSQDGSTTKTYLITVEKQFLFEDIVIQKFNNVLLVNNNPENNGGYRFVAYQWYKNNQPIGTGQYYSAGDNSTDILDTGAVYRVEMTTENGEVLQTCAFQVELSDMEYSVHISPNPVNNAENIRIYADFPVAELQNGMQIHIYSLTGQRVAQYQTIKKETFVPMYNMASGVYLVVCKTNKHQAAFKIIVE